MALGATTAPETTLAANVRTITGYTAGGKLNFEMSEIFQGAYCSADSGNTCRPIQYLSGTPLVGEFSGLSVLTVALWLAPSPTTVVGFSQGSLIATEWLRGNDGRWGAPSPEDLSFVLVANPLRKYGGLRPAYEIDEPTPDTRYEVLDIAIEYDGVADLPDNLLNFLAVANALAGSQYVHIYGYSDVDLENAEKLVWKDGNTTYVLIRNENIPLLEPMRELGLGALADILNDPLKAMIDSAYDRDYSGLVDPGQHASALQQFSSLGAEPGAAAAQTAAHRSSAVAESLQYSDPDLPDPESSATPGSDDAAAEDPTTEDPTAEDPTAGDPTAGDPTAEDPTAGDPTAEDPTAETEADEQSLDTETEPSTAELDEDVDIESDTEGAEDGPTLDAERSGDSVDADSASGSDTDESESLRGGEADGPDSESAAPSGESESTSGSSAA